jgi:hypothetical protein
MTHRRDFSGRMARATAGEWRPEPFPFRADDEDLNATSDYFWMLRSGVLEEHTAGAWQTFRAAYMAMGEHLRQGHDDGPPRQYAA